MLRRTLLGAGAALALTAGWAAAQDARTFYWISHGSPADPVWTYFLQGAEQFAEATGHDVNTSFHSGDVPSQQEAVRAAIAAGADGICSTSPDPGSMTDVVAEAREVGIPIANFNTSDDAPDWIGYVGGDLQEFGRIWAQYLVDNGHVSEGDFVWMPVEVPGASYGVEEEKGIATVFEPMGVTWEVTDATLDQAEIIQRMTDYLTANGDRIAAMIGLGDLVTGSVARVWDQAGYAPGDIPVVGWGNSLDTTQAVMDGYVDAAMWQDPQATSFMCLSTLLMEAEGVPLGFDIITGALYEAEDGAALPPRSWAASDPHGRAPRGRMPRGAPVRPAPTCRAGRISTADVAASRRPEIHDRPDRARRRPAARARLRRHPDRPSRSSGRWSCWC